MLPCPSRPSPPFKLPDLQSLALASTIDERANNALNRVIFIVIESQPRYNAYFRRGVVSMSDIIKKISKNFSDGNIESIQRVVSDVLSQYNNQTDVNAGPIPLRMIAHDLSGESF